MSDAKVTRLPTAARRKVQQPRHDVRRALAGHLEECPAEYVQPWVRKLLKDQKSLEGTAAETMKDSAALLIAVCTLAHADPVLKAKVFGSVFHWHQTYRTPETEKAVRLVEPMLRPRNPSPGAA